MLKVRLYLAMALAFPGFALEAEPLRVVLPPTPSLRNPTPDQSFHGCLVLYLHERLGECPSIRLISEGRAQAILNEIQSGKRRSSPEKRLEEFARFVPADALIEIFVQEKDLRVRLHLQSGRKEVAIPVPAPTAAWPRIQEAGRFLAEGLGLTETEARSLLENRLKAASAFQPYYVSQMVTAAWPMNSGEARLMLLRPSFNESPQDPLLASKIFEHTAMLITSANRQQDFAKKALETCQGALETLLGTPIESSAHTVLRSRPAYFENELLALARPLLREGLEDADKPTEADEEDAAESEEGLGLTSEAPVAGNPAARKEVTRAKQLTALRFLGVMRSSKGLDLLLQAAQAPLPDLRRAAATALHFCDKEGTEALQRLAGDADPETAFLAALSLFQRGQSPANLLTMARQSMANPVLRVRTAGVLAALAAPEDLPVLRALSEETDAEPRRQAVRALLRLGQSDALPQWLQDADEQVVISALAALGDRPDEGLLSQARSLANDPFLPIAEQARLALAFHRPGGLEARWLFDLAVEHPYVRKRIVDAIHSQTEEKAVPLLEQACRNPDPHTRAHALGRLADRSPARVHPHLLEAVRDPYHWVRLHAAALLPAAARPEDSEAIGEALKKENDPAIRMYLEDALAVSEGRPPPAPAPAAHTVQGKRNLAWLVGPGLDAPSSPFDAYYSLTVAVSSLWKEAHRAGKILFGRINNNVGQPGLIAVDPEWQDRFWLLLQGEVSSNNLPWLDGLVFGEESMSTDPSSLWPQGWRLFCLEAGLDPQKVQGDQKNLNEYERRAWIHWAGERTVEGFNTLYDYVKLRYGKLRPGIQVCTFLPEQGGPNPADLSWKFDVGGLYDYKGCNRMAAYTLVRRYKTLWPDRPVLWLSLGIGGYEMNPVKRTQRLPAGPLFTRSDRAWADALCAYMAGADTGWFSTWIFVDKNFSGGMADLRGVQILLEDIQPQSPDLTRAISYAFGGAEEESRLELHKPSLEKSLGDQDLKPPEIVEEEEDGVEQALTGEPSEKEKIAQKVEEEKKKFHRGFHYYRNYVYDCARILKSLPRQDPRPQALAVRPGVSVWTRPPTPYPLVPGMALPHTFDFVADVNQVPSLPIERYRLILLHDPGPLRDETLAALGAWLEKQPGLLYVHRNLSADSRNEASTPRDHDGVLRNRWPWADAVSVQPEKGSGKLQAHHLQGPDGKWTVKQAILTSTFAVQNASAQVLLESAGRPCLVLWRDPRFRAAVLFDGLESASGEYLFFLRKTLNDLHRDRGVGMPIEGPLLHVKLETETLTAAATTNYYAQVTEKSAYPGLDALTGEINPAVGNGRSGALVAKNFTGTYLVSRSGLLAVGESPLEHVETTDGGISLSCDGLLRVASETGKVQVRRADGVPLPEVDNPSDWIPFGETEGVAVLSVGNTGQETAFVRCKGPVWLGKADRE